VINEAIKENIDLIITFHPLIYRPLKTIANDERVGRLVTKLIKNSIAVVAVHTLYDAFIEGTSRILADKLGLQNIDLLVPDKAHQDRGMGIVGELPTPSSLEQLVSNVSDICAAPIRYNVGKGDKILKVAIVGGSGTSFLNHAIRSKADAFITADVTYHIFHAVKGELALIDPGHYEMEQFVPIFLHKYFTENVPEMQDIKLVQTSIHTNPVIHFAGRDTYSEEQINIINH
jgi:dinuclear metal center YbgI/SA1388 family protein